jgi:hypothetical protein
VWEWRGDQRDVLVTVPLRGYTPDFFVVTAVENDIAVFVFAMSERPYVVLRSTKNIFRSNEGIRYWTCPRQGPQDSVVRQVRDVETTSDVSSDDQPTLLIYFEAVDTITVQDGRDSGGRRMLS